MIKEGLETLRRLDPFSPISKRQSDYALALSNSNKNYHYKQLTLSQSRAIQDKKDGPAQSYTTQGPVELKARAFLFFFPKRKDAKLSIVPHTQRKAKKKKKKDGRRKLLQIDSRGSFIRRSGFLVVVTGPLDPKQGEKKGQIAKELVAVPTNIHCLSGWCQSLPYLLAPKSTQYIAGQSAGMIIWSAYTFWLQQILWTLAA